MSNKLVIFIKVYVSKTIVLHFRYIYPLIHYKRYFYYKKTYDKVMEENKMNHYIVLIMQCGNLQTFKFTFFFN